MITLLAVLANANEWIEIECFAKKKEKWLKKFLELPNGIPSDDTIRIVISSLNPNYLYNIILDFLIGKVDGILNTFRNENSNEIKDIMAIDGKTSCGSGRNETDSPKKKALHTLNIYSSLQKSLNICVSTLQLHEKDNKDANKILFLILLRKIKGIAHKAYHGIYGPGFVMKIERMLKAETVNIACLSVFNLIMK